MTSRMYKEGIIKELSDIEIYRYGIDNGLNILLNLFISLCIAIVLRQEIILLVFLVSYVPLRAYSGGWHFSSKKVCCITSNVVIGSILFINKILSENVIAVCIVMVCSVVYLWNSKQKDSLKRKLNSVEQQVFNKKKRQTLFIVSAGAVLLIVFNMRSYATVIIVATTLTAMLFFFNKVIIKVSNVPE